MSFDKECSLTLWFIALILTLVVGLLYYKLNVAQQQVKMVELKLKDLEAT